MPPNQLEGSTPAPIKSVSFASEEKSKLAFSTPISTSVSASVTMKTSNSSSKKEKEVLAEVQVSEEVRQILFPEEDDTLTTDSEGRERVFFFLSDF